MDNPLLVAEGLPLFAQIKPSHVKPAIEHVLQTNREKIAQIADEKTPRSWEAFIQPLNDLSDRLNRVWSPVECLWGVIDSEGLRQAYNECLPLLTAYRNEIGQNKALFLGYQTVKNSAAFQQLTAAQQQIINNELKDFHLSGIDLPPDKQRRCKEIYQRLSKLNTQFTENLLDATHAWEKHITDEQLLAGLPTSVKALARQNAERKNLPGWILTLDAPCYQPAMNYLDNRDLRYELYYAYFTRASEFGPDEWDNQVIMEEILALRHELAHLLGFDNYAEFSLYRKMAETPAQVLEFLMDLAQRARPFAIEEVKELKHFAQTHYQMSALEMWDVPYFSEKLRQHRYAISQEMLRPYFPLSQVLQGLFTIVQRLYGISIQQQACEEIWHPDVQFYEIYDENGELRGQFYLDLFARKGKRGGAWMADCLPRKRTVKGVQPPLAQLVCNFSPPVDEQPSLLTHIEVLTLFHEFGHGLHHLLTKVDYTPVAGIAGVAWDAVELPSQFMENWCWEKESLDLLTAHYQTGESLSADLFEKMLAAKHFQMGLFTLRQLEFGLFDFRLHKDYTPDMSIQAVLDQVRQEIAVLIPPDFNRFQHSFSHIFAGGYAAGYYSYKWAEVLSADAFAKFEENGIFDHATGLQFLQTILEKGGSYDAMTLFTQFRGREPTIDALLRHCGMAA